MNIILFPSQNISVIQNFLELNSVSFQIKSIWTNNLYDFSLIDNNTLVILDFNAFTDIITVPDSLSYVIDCLNKNNHLFVWSDYDSGLHCQKILSKLEDIDKLLHNCKISLLIDTNYLFFTNYKNIKIYSTPNSTFEQEIPRKTFWNKESSNKDYILTIGTQREHRDILWKNLEKENLLSYGFTVYHRIKNQSNWLGSVTPIHDWYDGHPSADLYNNANFEIIPETCFKDVYFITEKTVKPISYKLPFLIVSTPGYLEFLRSKGYKTFSGIIDESYDSEENLEKRIELIVEQVKYIIKKDSYNFYNDSTNIREHNFDNLAKITGSWWTTMDKFLYKIVSDITKKLN